MTQQEWKGSLPCRFSGGRKHNPPQDSLSHFMKQSITSTRAQGLKTFSPKPTQQQEFVPSLRIFNEVSMKQTWELPPKGKKFTVLNEQKERIRPERSHVEGGRETSTQFDNRGIRVYDETYQSRNQEYNLENLMQRKLKVQGIQSKRNKLEISSLGDKPYKYPEYATDFYKSGGLVPGSTISYNGKKSNIDTKITGVLTKPNWDVRVKMDQEAEEKRILNSVDEWQQTILKEANPNWNDPDTFFQRELAKNQQAKDPKKGGKK